MMAPYRQSRLFVLIAIVLAIASGCSSGPPVVGTAATSTLIPDKSVNLSSSSSIALDKLIYWGGFAAAAYMILDPLAPNWDIEEAAFPDNKYYMTLKMKRYYNGGAGEARMVFQQRAKSLMLRAGFDAYEILEYNESLDSSLLGSQRVAQGVIALVRKQK
jgi:hypothetical protein